MPEPTRLKRQRSRPSSWWEAPPSNAPPPWVEPQAAQSVDQQVGRENGLVKKRKRDGLEAPPQVNGGVVVGGTEGEGSKGGQSAQMGEIEQASGEVGRKKLKRKKAPSKGQEEAVVGSRERALRRGRSPGGELESRELEGSAGTPAAAGGKRTKRAAQTVEELGEEQPSVRAAARKRGKAAATRAGELSEEERDELAVPKRQGRRSAAGFQKQIIEGSARKARKHRGQHASIGDEDQADELMDGTPEEVAPKRSRRAPTIPVEAEVGADLPKVPNKRGGPLISQHEEITTHASAPVHPLSKSTKKDSQATSNEELVPRKKRRPKSEVQMLEQNLAQFSDTSTPVRGRTRTRPSTVIAFEPPKAKDQERGSKLTRQSIAQPDALRVEPEERGGRRTRRSDAETQAELVPESAIIVAPKAVKAKRRSEVIEVETASSKLTKNRGSKQAKPSASVTVVPKTSKISTSNQQLEKPKKGVQASSSVATKKPVPSQANRKSSNRLPEAEASSRKRSGVEDSGPVPRKRRRSSKVAEQNVNDEPQAEPVPYQHLKAVTRRVSRQTIETKWGPLPPTCVDRIAKLLQDIQRSVLVHIHDEKKKIQATSALQGITRRLTAKVSRGLPFPPGTRRLQEDDFDFEKILDLNRALEAQLTPALHSNALLEAELGKELALLEYETASMVELETNASSAAVARNKAARKLHSVLRSDGSTLATEAVKDDIGLDVVRQFQSLDLEVRDDPDVQALIDELDGHVESIQGNIKQVEGISQAMANSRAAVQATLFGRLDSTQFDDVVLGWEE